jgi:hypothetical protein
VDDGGGIWDNMWIEIEYGSWNESFLGEYDFKLNLLNHGTLV